LKSSRLGADISALLNSEPMKLLLFSLLMIRLVFLNAGDEFAGDAVLDAVNAAVTGPAAADFVFGDAIDVAPDGALLYRKARAHTNLWWTMFACHQAMFFSRGRLGDTRYRLRYRNAADYAFVAEFLRRDHPAGPPVVKRVDGALCRFWLGGNSWQNRPTSIREDFQIRAQHIGVSAPVNVALFLAHYVHMWLKRNVPWLTRKLRYRQ